MNNKYIKIICAFMVVISVHQAVQANVGIIEEERCYHDPVGDRGNDTQIDITFTMADAQN